MVVPAHIWQDLAMRQGWVWAVSIAAVGLLLGCDGQPVQAAEEPDVLVLEVGGAQPSLRAALVSMGRTVAPGRVLRPRSIADSLGEEQRQAGPTVGPGFGPQIEPVDERIPDGPKLDDPKPDDSNPGDDGPGDDGPGVVPPESPWVIVKLPKDETLIHLARRYLGDGRRFGEIMTWNGWSEPETRKLRDGHEVKIKRSEMR